MKKYTLLKARKNSRRLKNHFLLSYVIILAIVLLIGVVLYQTSYKQVKEGIHQQNRLALSSSITQFDNSMKLMNASARQVTSNTYFNTLSGLKGNEGSDFYYLAYETQLSLKTMTPLEVLLPITNSFIYMKNSNYIISSSLFSEFDLYTTYRYQIKPMQFSANILDHTYWNKFIPFLSSEREGMSYAYLYPLSSSPLTSTEAESVLFYEFDYKRLMDLFSSINLYSDGYLVAYDKNGTQMFFLSPKDQTPDQSMLGNLDYDDGISSYLSADNEGMLVTQAASPYNNWTYYMVQPENEAYYSISSYQRLFTAIAFVALAFGVIVSFVFSFMGNRKLTNLSKELIVKESLASSLNLLVEKQKPVVIESYMRRIMEGSVTSNDEMQYIMQQLGLDRPDMKFHVLYTEVFPSEESNISADDMELCIQNYDMLVREALQRHYPDTGYIYKPSDRTFAILIASDKTLPYEQVVNRDREIFISLHKELLTNYGIVIYGGLGGRNGLISYTWKSYQQAKDAKSITTAEKYILSCTDYANSSDVYYYPESLSVQLSGFISTGNKEQVSELFKLIHNENTVKRSLAYNQQRWLISDIRSTVFKKRHNIDTASLESDKLKILDLVDKQFEGEMSLSSLKTIALELCDVCGTETEGNDMILKIQEYINQNYHDPNLCLTKISDEFGISENYFSYLFKKEVSENFSTYLERHRMAKAKEMILESDTSLSTLYQYLGYNNAASFRRAFKKNFGVSPKEMRDKVNAK